MMEDFGADPALVASQSSQQVVSTKGFDPGEGAINRNQFNYRQGEPHRSTFDPARQYEWFLCAPHGWRAMGHPCPRCADG